VTLKPFSLFPPAIFTSRPQRSSREVSSSSGVSVRPECHEVGNQCVFSIAVFFLIRCHVVVSFGLVWLDVEVMIEVLAHDAPIQGDRFVFLRRCLKLLVPLQSPRGDLQGNL